MANATYTTFCLLTFKKPEFPGNPYSKILWAFGVVYFVYCEWGNKDQYANLPNSKKEQSKKGTLPYIILSGRLPRRVM